MFMVAGRPTWPVLVPERVLGGFLLLLPGMLDSCITDYVRCRTFLKPAFTLKQRSHHRPSTRQFAKSAPVSTF